MTEKIATHNPTLYELEESLMWAFQQITEAHAAGQEPPAEVTELIESFVDSAMAKRDRCAQFLRHLESLEVSIDSEVKRLQEKARRTSAARERFEAYILIVMDRLGMKRLEGTTHALVAKNNPPSVAIDNPEKIPAEFLRPPKPAPPQEADKAAIKKALQAKQEVPGARLVTGKRRLEVA